ncbi:MAG TPA: outer membrane beta-barrel protein [Candidatus Acidoferrales bacterium]|nr:outer membrane beta-barrel protein [Candidatus Acidoferrales bacterium]
MRKLALLLTPVAALLFSCHFAAAQQGDIAFGGGTLLSSSPNSSSLSFQNLAEKGGTYLTVSGDIVGVKRRLGFDIETAWRASQASYYGYESYRPILTAFNAMYQPHITHKVGLDLLGGIGIASTRFYVPYATSCSYFSGCINYTSSDHFMEDLGAGVRYYVWHHFFVRPEVRYYHIQNNTDEFNSSNIFRVGGSIGYTIGPD